MTDIYTAAIGAQALQMGLNDNGCGHIILLTKDHYESCRETGRVWWCTICGSQRKFIGKTTVDELRGELAAAKQQAETLRAQRNEAEEKLQKEQRSKAALRKRIAKGVCPCCKRTVSQMARHMATKHPNYATVSTDKV